MDTVLELEILLPSAVFLAVAGTFIALGSRGSGQAEQLADRLKNLSRTDDPAAGRHRNSPAVAGRFPVMTETLLLSNPGRRARLQNRFLEAGIHQDWALSVFVVARLVLALLLPAIAFLAAWLLKLPPSYGLAAAGPAALVGACLPHVWLERRRARQHLLLRRAIPDFLDLIVACLGGGLSVQAALKQVAEELKLAHRELSSELGIALREIDLGGSLDYALEQLALRTGLEELKTLRSFVHQTTKFGTTITDALAQLADMIRIQREQRAEEMAQKVAVKILFPTMLFIFPTVFVVLAGPAAIQIQEGLLKSMHQESAATPHHKSAWRRHV